MTYNDFKTSLWHELAELFESVFKIIIDKNIEVIKSDIRLIDDVNSFNPNFLKYLDDGYTIKFDNDLHFGFFFPYQITKYCMNEKKYIISSLRIKLSNYLQMEMAKSSSEVGIYKVKPVSDDRITIFTDVYSNESLLCMSFPLKVNDESYNIICYIDEKHVKEAYCNILDKMGLWNSWNDFFKDPEFKEFMCNFLTKNKDKINPNFAIKIFK